MEKVMTKKFEIYEQSKLDREFYSITNSNSKNGPEKLSVPCKKYALQNLYEGRVSDKHKITVLRLE